MTPTSATSAIVATAVAVLLPGTGSGFTAVDVPLNWIEPVAPAFTRTEKKNSAAPPAASVEVEQNHAWSTSIAQPQPDSDWRPCVVACAGTGTVISGEYAMSGPLFTSRIA